MNKPRKYPNDDESNPLTASEPEAVFGTVSRPTRMSVSQGITDEIDTDVPEYLMSEEAFQYFHPEVKVESLSELEIPVVSVKEMLKHGMSLEELDTHLTKKIHSYFHPDK